MTIYIDRYYKILEYPSDELMLIDHPRWGKQLWMLANLTKKYQARTCILCGEALGKKAYRPLTNLGNRMERICLNHKPESTPSPKEGER